MIMDKNKLRGFIDSARDIYEMNAPEWDDDYEGTELDRIAIYLCHLHNDVQVTLLELEPQWRAHLPDYRRYYRDEARALLNYMEAAHVKKEKG